MKVFKSVLASLAIAGIGASPAAAQFSCTNAFLGQGTYTGGSNFATTATACLSYSSGVITLEIRNEGVYGEVFAAVGLVNVPTGTVTGAGAPTGWSWSGGNQIENTGDGLPANFYAYGAPPPPAHRGLQVGQYGVFRFNVGNIAYQNIGFAVHAISGPEECSTKFAVWNGGQSNNDRQGEYAPTYDPNCVDVSVPEPESYALLLTGLFGLGFVAVRRRSRFEA